MSASRTRSVRPSRRCGTLRWAAAMVGSTGANPVASSWAPSMAGSRVQNSSAPSPHASQSTTSIAELVIRAVTGPLAIRLVFQMAPSMRWKQGSPGPRRSGDSVIDGLAGPPKVTLAELGIAPG